MDTATQQMPATTDQPVAETPKPSRLGKYEGKQQANDRETLIKAKAKAVAFEIFGSEGLPVSVPVTLHLPSGDATGNAELTVNAESGRILLHVGIKCLFGGQPANFGGNLSTEFAIEKSEFQAIVAQYANIPSKKDKAKQTEGSKK